LLTCFVPLTVSALQGLLALRAKTTLMMIVLVGDIRGESTVGAGGLEPPTPMNSTPP
jgi:hypothetical protein